MSTNLNGKVWSVLLLAASLPATGAFAVPAQSNNPAQQTATQGSVCTGTVYDELGEPMIGATVSVVGQPGKAVNTDIDGNFRFPSLTPGSKLEITYVGYKPMTVTWEGQPLNVTMETSSKALEEVVVMGYGITQKRANVTNSIAKVQEDILTVGANANPAQALAGAVSGVKVSITSGSPDATPSIVIRGGTDWSGNNDPLVVVDGQIRSSLADINPNDIGSMEILKDAGATAIYGARAANGVILITTKQGNKGTAQVNFNVKYGLNYYGSGGYDWLGAEDFLTVYRTAMFNTPWFNNGNPAILNTTLNSGGYPAAIGSTEMTAGSWFNVMTLTDANKHYVTDYGWSTMQDPVSDATILYKETNSLDYNLTNPSSTEDYNVSFSGGNDKGRYYASLGYYNAEGAFPSTFYKRYNFAMTGSYKLASWLEANSTFNFIRANWNNQIPASSNGSTFWEAEQAFGRIASIPPVLRLEDEEGNRLIGNGATNFYYQPEKFDRDNQSDKFAMTQSLTATIIEGLTLKGSMSWFYNESLSESFNHDFKLPNGNTSANRATSDSYGRSFEQTYNLVANFHRTFQEKHDVSATLGMEYFHRKQRGFSASGSGADTDDFQNLALTFNGSAELVNNALKYRASTRSMSSYHREDAILSYLGRVEYNYDSKYHVAATFREDGYSRLINNRWGFFPGVSAGWTFSRENFWKDNQALNFINYAKLRSSYGLNGIVNTGVIGWYTLYGSFSAYKYHDIYGYRMSALPNPSLRWEKTRTFEVGLDLGFLQNRFNLGLTYYNRLTSDKYASFDLPFYCGSSSITSNNGKYRNQGVEIDVNATILRTAGVTWTLGANLTYNKNIVVELPDNDAVNNAQGASVVWNQNWKEGDPEDQKTILIGGRQEGQEPGHMIGQKVAYMLRSEEDVKKLGDYIDVNGFGGRSSYATEEGRQRLAAMGKTGKQLMPGDIVWVDRNGDNMIDSWDYFDLGCSTPHWTGGFNTSVSWKGLTLYARFDMGWGFRVNDSFLGWALGCGQGGYNAPSQVFDTWSESNPNAKYPRYTYADQLGMSNYFRTSNLLMESGAYLACRELSLSYQLPLSICQKFWCKGLTASITGQNLGYIKKCTNPLPDKNNFSGSNNTERAAYPLPVTLLFGLNVTF